MRVIRGQGSASVKKLVSAVVALACAGAVVVGVQAGNAGPVINHATLVPDTPATGYPIILDTPTYLTFNPNCNAGCSVPREVLAANQVGRYIISGGNFLNVEQRDGTVLNQAYFTAWNIDTKQIACTKTVFDDEVNAIEPGPTPDTFYVAGRFSKVTGPDGVQRTRNKVVKLKLPDCSVDTTFVSTGANNKIGALGLVGNRLFVGGDFTSIGGRAVATVAELDATTGAVNPAFSFPYTNSLTSRVRGMGISPDGTRLVIAGRFGTVTGNGRSVTNPTAIFDITDPAAPKLTPHSSSGYVSISNLQDATVAQDAKTIGLAYGAATVADFVYLTPTTEAATGYRWVHQMNDSSFGIGIANNAVYVGGHFCKPKGGPGASALMAPNTLDTCTGSSVAGGVWRTKLAALSLTDGTPLTWNPGQDSFTGAREVTVIPRGLLIGYDGVRTNHIRVGATAFMDFGPGVEDLTPPSNVTFTAPAANGVVNNPMALSGVASDNVGVKSYRVAIKAADGRWLQPDGTLTAVRTEFKLLAAANGTFTLNLTMPAGSYSAEAKAVDAAGFVSPNWSFLPFVQSGIEGVPPTTTVVVPAQPIPTETPVTISGVATDNVAVSNISVSVRNAAGLYLQDDFTLAAGPNDMPVVATLGTPSVAWSVNLGDTLPVDNYRVDVVLLDPSNNVGTASGTFAVTNVVVAAQAAVSAYTGFSTATGSYTLGSEVTFAANTTITALGAFDANGNGRLDTAGTIAAIWRDSDRALLGQVTIAQAAPSEGGWFYGQLATPLVLTAGVKYVVAYQNLSNGEPYAFNGTRTPLAGVTFGAGRYVAATTLSFPTSTAQVVGYGIANFKVQTQGAALVPQVAITAPTAVPISFGAQTTISGTAIDNKVVKTLSVQVANSAGSFLQDDGTMAATPNDLELTFSGVGTPNATFNGVVGPLDVGAYTVTVAATDAVANRGVSTSTFAVTAGGAAVAPAIASHVGYTTGNGNFVTGYTFRAASAKQVFALGVFDANGNGVLNAPQDVIVAIWRQSDQRELARVTVPRNATVESGWFYANLATPLTLQPGVTYVVGYQSFQSFFGGGEPYASGGTRTMNPDITFLGSAYKFGSTIGYPGTQNAGNSGYGMPNFKIGTNNPPVVLAVADQNGTVGVPIAAVRVRAADPEGGVLRYAATGLPAGVAIDPATGLITGTPTAAGVASVVVTVTDPTNLVASRTFTWTIVAAPAAAPAPAPAPVVGNDAAPVVDPIADVTVVLGTPITPIQVVATDPEGGPVSYAAVDLPIGLTIDAQTGVISGTPTVAGVVATLISATDPAGHIATTTLHWVVQPAG